MSGGCALQEPGLLWEETLRGGSAWSHVLKRGTALRITDIEGGANAGALFYNFEIPSERYNMPDTLKAQQTAYLTKGFVLYSDMGRVLCSIIGDSVGWHDTVCGHQTPETALEKYGRLSYQEARNDFHRNARENFLIELAKFGLGARDLHPNVNFFSKTAIGEEGQLRFVTQHSKPGSWVELRAEMNVLAIVDTCQHPLDPNSAYQPRPVELSVFRVPPAGPDDFCRHFRPENQRGFVNTERYFL